MKRLEELIDVLDQPLRQVELQAQFVEINGADIKLFCIDSVGEGNVGFVRGNFTAKLNALIANGRAKVISAPRVTAINNMSATMDAATPPTNGKTPTWAYNFTPTINGDDTITILFQDKNKPAEVKLNTIVNVRDGDSIALSLGAIPQAAGATITPKSNLVFVTARIVQRASDKISVPAK